MATDWNNLNEAERKVIREALGAAFTELDSLTMFLRFALNRELSTLVVVDTVENIIAQLVDASQRANPKWTLDLVTATELRYREHPRVVALRNTLDNMSRLLGPQAPALQRDIGGHAIDMSLWIASLQKLQRQICRIEFPKGVKMGGGTGFLIGPNLVLTNYHVIEDHHLGSLPVSEITCWFDVTGDPAHEPIAIKLASDWLKSFSRHSPFDPGDLGGVPGEDTLDYAVLKLNRSIGDENLGVTPRAWLALNGSKQQPTAKDVLTIGQHPKQMSLKIAQGPFLMENSKRTRWRYAVQTDKGSSGAPCLDACLNVVALHHGGDPDFNHPVAEFNQGVPIELISTNLANLNLPLPSTAGQSATPLPGSAGRTVVRPRPFLVNDRPLINRAAFWSKICALSDNTLGKRVLVVFGGVGMSYSRWHIAAVCASSDPAKGGARFVHIPVDGIGAKDVRLNARSLTKAIAAAVWTGEVARQIEADELPQAPRQAKDLAFELVQRLAKEATPMWLVMDEFNRVTTDACVSDLLIPLCEAADLGQMPSVKLVFLGLDPARLGRVSRYVVRDTVSRPTLEDTKEFLAWFCADAQVLLSAEKLNAMAAELDGLLGNPPTHQQWDDYHDLLSRGCDGILEGIV